MASLWWVSTMMISDFEEQISASAKSGMLERSKRLAVLTDYDLVFGQTQ
jgi:hypothetical protein